MQFPFFIVGFSRSGTTLLARLLDNHSKVCVTPETRYCRGVFPCGQVDSKPRNHEFIANRIMSYWRIKDLNISKAEFLGEFLKWESSYRNGFVSLLECYRRTRHKPLIGEKSPIHLSYVPILVEWFPDAAIFCLVRDGRDVVSSMLKAPFTHNNPLRHAAEWTATAKRIRRLEDQYPGNFQVIRFETLVTDPQGVLKDVCGRLGLEFEPGQLEPVGESRVIPDWEKPWKSEAAAAVDSSKVALWRTNLSPRAQYALSAIMSRELDHWEYQSSAGRAMSLPMRLIIDLVAIVFRDPLYSVFRSASTFVRVVLCRIGLKEYW